SPEAARNRVAEGFRSPIKSELLEDELFLAAKGRGIRRPGAETASHHVRNDQAYVPLLRGVVVGAGMVAGDRHRPVSLALAKVLQETCGVGDVLRWVEHFLDRGELFVVIMVVDLHAAEIDQLDSLLPFFLKLLDGGLLIFGKMRTPGNVHG